jgi:hypothetical protein
MRRLGRSIWLSVMKKILNIIGKERFSGLE